MKDEDQSINPTCFTAIEKCHPQSRLFHCFYRVQSNISSDYRRSSRTYAYLLITAVLPAHLIPFQSQEGGCSYNSGRNNNFGRSLVLLLELVLTVPAADSIPWGNVCSSTRKGHSTNFCVILAPCATGVGAPRFGPIMARCS